jgi:hypothetical protein
MIDEEANFQSNGEMKENESMDFKDKIEAVLAPMIGELRRKLAAVPTIHVLDHYQLRIDTVQYDKSNVPDGFIFKWRYIWGQLLSGPFLELKHTSPSAMTGIDELVEKIFQVYEFGAVQEHGRDRASEKEFLTRLGLAIRVREPDTLAFPEQIQEWGEARLQHFNDSFFLPIFGLSQEKIIEWISTLILTCQSRLNACVRELASIVSDAKPINAGIAHGDLDLNAARSKAEELKIGERLETNARNCEGTHIFSVEDLRIGIPPSALTALTGKFAIGPGEVSPEFMFPHDKNPLEHKLFVALPNNKFYFLDPANAYRIAVKTFEKDILADTNLRDRYLKIRDRAAERWVAERMRRVFPKAAIYPNYYLEKGAHEKDLLIRHEDAVILVECKNSKIRAFKGTTGDLLKFERDFENSVQFGYEQALEVKRRVLETEEAYFFDRKGRPSFSIKRSEIQRFYIVCVTLTPRGPFGTDLSYELTKPAEEPFPLALNLFDIDTICKHLNTPDQFLGYLRARERLHGRSRTGDELNYAGFFLKFGNLDFQKGELVTDDFSGIFDRAWFKEKGIDIDEPNNPPVRTTMIRQGNRLNIEHSTGRKEVINIPPELIESATGESVTKMKGRQRNKPCPCGSGRKFKHCHGIS